MLYCSICQGDLGKAGSGDETNDMSVQFAYASRLSKKETIPTIHFQVRTVSFSEGNALV